MPLVVPLAIALFVQGSNPGNSPIFGFLFFAALGCIVSYATTVFLFLPAVPPLETDDAEVVLGMPRGLCSASSSSSRSPGMEFRSSGPDSGPPEGTFLGFLWRSRTDAAIWIFPIGGLITATAFWILGGAPPHPDQSQV